MQREIQMRAKTVRRLPTEMPKHTLSTLPSLPSLRSLRSLRLCGSIVFILLLAVPLRVGAHPLGNFTVNRYSRIEIGPERVQVQYVLDMAEIPAFQELRA